MSQDLYANSTLKVALCVIASSIIIFFIAINIACAETAVIQTIKVGYDKYIKVIYECPENMELGDDISFYCEFIGCQKDDFNYTWQYSHDGTYWTNFGSHPRKNTTYSAMLAGKYIRLVVEEKENRYE